MAGGRWARLSLNGPSLPRDEAVQHYAMTLLARYGVMFRRLLAREPYGVPWRQLVRVYRRLEARGEIGAGGSSPVCPASSSPAVVGRARARV